MEDLIPGDEHLQEAQKASAQNYKAGTCFAESVNISWPAKGLWKLIAPLPIDLKLCFQIASSFS